MYQENVIIKHENEHYIPMLFKKIDCKLIFRKVFYTTSYDCYVFRAQNMVRKYFMKKKGEKPHCAVEAHKHI